MAGIVDKLGSTQGALLMYLANELDAEDRADVDRMLLADAKLREELDGLRRLDASLRGGASIGETADRGLSQEMAVRRVMSALRRHHLQAASAQPVRLGRAAWPWWTYPVAAAAAAAFVFVGLWAFEAPPFARTNSVAQVPVSTDEIPQDELAAELERSFDEFAMDSSEMHLGNATADEDDSLLLMM
jgi:anti-sigma factor RsiW